MESAGDLAGADGNKNINLRNIALATKKKREGRGKIIKGYCLVLAMLDEMQKSF